VEVACAGVGGRRGSEGKFPLSLLSGYGSLFIRRNLGVVERMGLTHRQIIENAVSDVDYLDQITGKVRDAVVASYVDGLWWSHGRSFSQLFCTLFIQQSADP